MPRGAHRKVARRPLRRWRRRRALEKSGAGRRGLVQGKYPVPELHSNSCLHFRTYLQPCFTEGIVASLANGTIRQAWRGPHPQTHVCAFAIRTDSQTQRDHRDTVAVSTRQSQKLQHPSTPSDHAGLMSTGEHCSRRLTFCNGFRNDSKLKRTRDPITVC